MHIAYSEIGDFKNAFHTLEKLRFVETEMYNVEKTKSISEHQTKYETEKKETQLKQLQIENLNSEMRLLKSQMNPHFIFNAIGSVSNLIESGDTKEAKQTLEKFSHLMRSVLQQSRGDMVVIEEEVALLESYLHLEKKVLGESFEYTFHIDENIDTSYDRIPSLMIQPIVENAIKHGLRTKEGDKKLKVNFKLDLNISEDTDNSTIETTESYILIEIEDNGIGRNASAELNKNRINHQSFATKSIEDRIHIINITEGADKISMNIVDLIEGENAIGTKVELKVRL
jgi:two-component system, LytTR family, sensor kinase